MSSSPHTPQKHQAAAPGGQAPKQEATFLGHPTGLPILFFTEMWERFSFYGMRSILALFLTASVAQGGWGWDAQNAQMFYGLYGLGAEIWCGCR